VELYAGDAECPNAQYVVLRGDVRQRAQWGSWHVVTRDHCLLPQKRLARVRSELTIGGEPDRATLLVGTPGAQVRFGIKMDVVARPVLDPRDGSVALRCGSLMGNGVIYGSYPSATAPALTDGKALRLVKKQWRQVEPQPTNSYGVTGRLGSCSSKTVAPRVVPPAPTAYPLCDPIGPPTNPAQPAGVKSTAGPKRGGLPAPPKSGSACGCFLSGPLPNDRALGLCCAAIMAVLFARRRRCNQTATSGP